VPRGKIGIGRTDVEDARLGNASSAGIRLLIDEMRYPGAGTRHSVSPSASSVAACSTVSVRSGTPCARAARREQHLGAAHREGKHAGCRALQEARRSLSIGDLPMRRRRCVPGLF
jgi:hypothetical protein